MPFQRSVYDELWRFILDENCLTGVMNVSRQSGKSFTLHLIGTEIAQRVPGCQIRIAAPTGLEMRKVCMPIMRQILSDCPEKYMPKWKTQDSMWVWPNGSEMHIAGVNDGHADNMRGTRSHLALVDEAGFVDDLEYLVNSVLMPQTLSTGGTIIISSTPPRTPAHDYVEIARNARLQGYYIHRDIYATNYTEWKIKNIAEANGGFESSTWKREYLAQFVIDDKLAIVPEWRDVFVQEPDPDGYSKFWHKYESMDLGVRDFTACLFAHYNFRRASVYVQDELVINGPKLTTPLLAAEIRAKETALEWNPMSVYRRVADSNNPMLLNDLAALHDTPFYPTGKDQLPAMVNELRTWVSGGRVRVHPRCKNLIDCLKEGIWKNEAHIGKEFGRTKGHGHFDALAALIYLVRNIDVSTNPIPAGHGLDPQRQWINPAAMDRISDTSTALKKMFGIRKG